MAYNFLSVNVTHQRNQFSPKVGRGRGEKKILLNVLLSFEVRISRFNHVDL